VICPSTDTISTPSCCTPNPPPQPNRTRQVKPLEEAFKFSSFFSAALHESDFEAKPSVLLIGQVGGRVYVGGYWWGGGEGCNGCG